MSNVSSKNFGGPGTVITIAVAVFLAAQLLAGVIVGLGIAIFRPGANVTDLLNNSTPAQAAFLFLAESLAAGVVFYILRRNKLGLKAIGLRRLHRSDIGKGLVGFGVFYVLLIIASIVLTFIFPGLNSAKQDIGFNNVAGAGTILAFIALVIIPPLGEEILVRGYLFSGLRARLSFVKAGLIVSVLFSLAHLELGSGAAPVWSAAADTFILSLVLVYLREATGALYAGMLVHMLNNLIAFMVKFH